MFAAVDSPALSGEGCDTPVMGLVSSLTCRGSVRRTVVHAFRLEGESMLRHGRLRLPEPAAVIRRLADLIAVGTVGRVGVPGLLRGNTAEQLVS